MQILKEQTHSILFSPVGIGGAWHLQIAVMLYFALDDPDAPLSEQELWPQVSPYLGTNGLDPGYPKPRGEVLAAGNWHAPRGQAVGGGNVSISVGDVTRELLIFGDRYWRMTATGAAPSPPSEIVSMPLVWESAFGGENFAENPVGKGFARQATPWNETRRYLPNVEDPQTGLVGAPTDTVTPACFLPLPADSPARLALAGTYDDAWLKQLWPGFPRDVQPDYFLLASPAQRLREGWFAGGEAVRIENMHPRKPLLGGRLPRKRVRVYISRKLPQHTASQYSFEEAATRLDTVWLFPELERGVVLYRALVPCADDEYSDIFRLMTAVEEQSDEVTDIQHWHQEQERQLQRAKPVPADPLKEAQPLVEKALHNVRTLEEDAYFTLDQALGQSPAMPMNTTKRINQAEQQVHAALKQVDDAQNMVKELRRGEFGHRIKIQPRSFDAIRERVASLLPGIQQFRQEMAEGMAELGAIAKEGLAKAKDSRKRLLEFMTAEGITDVNFPEPELPPLPEGGRPATWSEAALALLEDIALEPTHEQWKPLRDAGLRHGDILRGCLAQATQDYALDDAPLLAPLPLPPDWPVSMKTAHGAPCLPPTLLVPYFEGARCVRLGLRPLPCEENPLAPFDCSAETLFPGSGEGVQLLAATKAKPLLITPDPLTAWLLYAHVGDIFAIVIPTSPKAKPTPTVEAAFAVAPCAFCLAPPLAVEGGLPPLPEHTFTQRQQGIAAVWAALGPCEAVTWSTDFAAPHLAEARRKGLDIRRWLCDTLRQRQLPTPPPALPEETPDSAAPQPLHMNLPIPDVKALVLALHQKTSTAIDAKKVEAQALIAAAPKDFNAQLAKRGIPPINIPLDTFDKMPDIKVDPEALRLFDQQVSMAKLAKAEDSIPKIEQARQMYIASVHKAQAAVKDAEAKIDHAQKVMADPIGMLAPEEFKNHPQLKIFDKKPMTPQLALEQLASNAGPGMTLANVDFSGMDLSGRVFSRVIMENINFHGATLHDVTFDNCIGNDLDFSEADCTNMRWEMISFKKCDFTRTVLIGLKANLSQLGECLFQDAHCKDATFKLTNMDNCTVSGVVEQASFELSALNGPWKDVVLRDCRIKKCTRNGSEHHNLRMQGGEFTETGFVECTGSGLYFSNVNAYNLRFLNACVLDGVHFENCNLEAASLRESTLTHAVLRHCNLKRACIERCELPRVVMEQCAAPEAQLRHSNFEEAQLVRLSLPGGSLRRSRMVRANLRGANLYCAELFKAILGETCLDGANLKGTLLHNAETLLHKENMTP